MWNNAKTLITYLITAIIIMYIGTAIHEYGHLTMAWLVGHDATLGEIGFMTGCVYVSGDVYHFGGVIIALGGVAATLVLGAALIASRYEIGYVAGAVTLLRTWHDLVPNSDLDGGVCAAILTEVYGINGVSIMWALTCATALTCIVGMVFAVVKVYDLRTTARC